MTWRLPIAVFILVSAAFAQSDVRNFGAAGNGAIDDTLAIQNAINACPPMGTVTFPDGNYSVGGLALKSQCTYAGTGHSTLTLSNPNGFIFDVSGSSGIHITGLVLDGHALGGGVIAQGTAPVENLQIDNCVFQNVPAAATFPAYEAIVSTWGIINATIQNNRFSNIGGGLWLTAIENVGLLNNSFVNVTFYDAIYVAPIAAPFPNGDDLRITGNSGTNMARIAIELFRPDPANGSVLTAPLIANNSFSNWTGAGGAGLSITHGDGAIIAGNRLSNATGPAQNTGIEVIVANAQVTNNDISGGFGQGITVVGTAAPSIVGNHIDDVSDTGIILSCDTSRNRCSSWNSVISGNSIVNAQLIGIKLDDDWSNSLISRNTITRTAGFWPQDNTVVFSGIHQSPAPGPGIIDSNAIIQDSTTSPPGFWFCGVRLNGSMPGSAVTNNIVRSLTSAPLGSGLLDNTGTSTVGWIIAGNVYLNTVQ